MLGVTRPALAWDWGVLFGLDGRLRRTHKGISDMEIKSVTTETFDADVLASDKPVLVPDDGRASLEIHDLATADRLMVMVELLGGSNRPTTASIATVDVP